MNTPIVQYYTDRYHIDRSEARTFRVWSVCPLAADVITFETKFAKRSCATQKTRGTDEPTIKATFSKCFGSSYRDLSSKAFLDIIIANKRFTGKNKNLADVAVLESRIIMH